MGCTVISSSGLGEYIYGFPCPYDSVVDPGSALQPLMVAAGLPAGLGQYLPAAPAFYPQIIKPKGLGCCNCDEGMNGLTMDGTGLFGTGLFSGGMDLSTWGYGEYGVIAFAICAISSLVSDTKRGYGTVRKKLRRKKAA